MDQEREYKYKKTAYIYGEYRKNNNDVFSDFLLVGFLSAKKTSIRMKL